MTTIATTPDEAACSCPDYRSSRRSVLKGLGLAAGAGVVSQVTDGIFRQVAFADSAAAATTTNTLVILSLRGGADGLSMVVPHGDPAYYAARPRIAVPRSQLIGQDSFFGLHPAFQPLLPMWNQGKMAAVHAVGMAAPNRSHFSAMEMIEDADPGSTARVGWLNRLIGLSPSAAPTDAVQVGTSMIPTSLYGPESVLGLRKTSTVGLPGAKSGSMAAWKRNSLDALYANDSSALGLGSMAALDAAQVLAPLAKSQPPPAPGSNYPNTPLGAVMTDTARLLKAGLGVEAVTVDFGGWDMHTNVGNLSTGTMKPMITELAGVLASFFADLGPLGNQVTLITLSEFGRRVTENASVGLDHGYGNVMLALGAGVVGGQVYGSWPGLGTPNLVNGDLAVTRDYRSVLTEVLRSRTNADTTRVFPGFVSDPALGFMS